MHKVALYIQGCLFVAVVLFVGVFSLRAASEYTPDREADWVTGGQTSVYEKHYDKQLPVRDVGINVWAALEYLLFKEGRSGVVVGKQDWLYTSEEFVSFTEDKDKTNDNLQFVESVSAQLQAKGIDLLVAVVPAKARVYPEFLGDKKPSSQSDRRYQHLSTWLNDKGIYNAPLLEPLTAAKAKNATYLRTDTHWTPWGASIAAKTIAKEVKHLFPELDRTQAFVSVSQSEVSHSGDLMSYIPLGDWLSSLGPVPEMIAPVSTDQVGSDESASLNLFDAEENIEISLVGTSYSANKTWNFPGFLRESLAADIYDYSQEGKGPFEPMADYLSSDEFKENPPKLVIWELPERFLPVTYSDEIYLIATNTL